MNHCICLASCSTAFTNTALPSSSFTGPVAFGFWDDLYMYADTSQTVYHATTGIFPSRILTFEFYTVHYTSPTQYFHFQIRFYEEYPNIVTYLYYQVSDGGASATIGVQASVDSSSMTYSVNQPTIPIGLSTANSPTLILTFDTNRGTYTSSASI